MRHCEPGGHAIRSYDDVAALMAERGYPMCWQRVQQIERSALRKLRLMMGRSGITFDDLEIQSLNRETR